MRFEPLSSLEGSGFNLLKPTLLSFIIFTFIHCTKEAKNNLPILQPDAVYKLEVKEPSDLCFGSSTDILYTVSDNAAQVYKLTTNGKYLNH